MDDTEPIGGIAPTRRLRRTAPSRTRQRPRQPPEETGEEEDDSPARNPDKRRGRKGRFIDERC